MRSEIFFNEDLTYYLTFEEPLFEKEIENLRATLNKKEIEIKVSLKKSGYEL